MLINRNKIKKILKEQSRLDFGHRGYSPSLVYGCVYHLGIKNTEAFCEDCRNYPHCESYLGAVGVEINPFENHRREIYRKIVRGEKLDS